MVEGVFIFPFIVTGRIIALLKPLRKEYRIYFFFPFYHTGGAEKVHLQIAAATGGEDCIIYFTRKSADDRFLNEFKKTNCTIKDISTFTDNKWLYFLNLIYRGIVTGYINSQKQKPVVFNGQCNFAYKISPWVKKHFKQIELIHSLNSFSFIRIPFIPFISKTVMISHKRIEDHKLLYEDHKIPLSFAERIIYISNAIPLPEPTNNDRPFNPFRVLYAGRPGIEKRIHLVVEMAGILNRDHKDIQFELIGDMSSILKPSDYPFIKFHGNINDDEKMNQLYSQSHLLLITSTTEGFPMVIMEAMANGCAIMATAVGDIPYHVKNEENGFLFSSISEENIIVKEGCEKILWLKNNPSQWKEMSEANTHYAFEHFDLKQFNAAYKNLLQ